MAVPWYEWRNIRNRLIVFGRAIQGVSPYRVIIEPDTAKCPSGFCNFTTREIAVNPGLFNVSYKDQYQLTKAILVHEAGHRRFTTPKQSSPVVDYVANILEDERIERQMCQEFVGVRWLIHKLAKILYTESMSVNKTSDSPGEVVAYFLQLRWSKRIGLPVKGMLSDKNEELWRKVEPLVYEAWYAETSDTVDRNAKEIVRILGITEHQIPEWIRYILDKLGSITGERGEGEVAERASTESLNDEASGEIDINPAPFDGDVLPNDSRVGKGIGTIEPMPYIHLEEKVMPLVQELIDELANDEKPDQWEPVDRGGRLSLREYQRDKKYPFLDRGAQEKAIPTVAIKIIIDHSTSLNHTLNGKTRMESISEAVMALHMVCLELNINHEVVVTPQMVKIADLDSGERGKALIAGLSPALCGHEDMGMAIKTFAVPMARYPEDIKLVFCLTDGACNDAELGKKLCRSLRGKVEVIGILLDPDERTRTYVASMFGEDRLIANRSGELPRKLGDILRAIRGI